MQVFATLCPNCNREVESTIEHLDEAIVCPHCTMPFEMAIPQAVVEEVRQVDERDLSDRSNLAAEPEERELMRKHPALFRSRPLAALALLVTASAATAGVYYAYRSDAEWAGIGLWGAGLVCALVGVVLLKWILSTLFTTLIVTDSRSIVNRGIISRDSSEVQHDDVRNVQLDQNFVERLLNIGDIGISSSGQDDLEVTIKSIPSPNHVLEVIRENQR